VTEHPPIDLAYEAQLEARLQELLKNGPRSLQILVAGSEGAYPTDVLAALRRLQKTGSIKETQNREWLSIDTRGQPIELRADLETPPRSNEPEFPEPHPLDFDWRFDARTLESLDRILEELNSTSIAILGAPTLFKYLVDRGKHAHLFDRNTQIVQFLKRSGYQAVSQCDLSCYSPELQFECVVADPPWYLDYYQAFLVTSHKFLVAEGKLLLSILPRLTRPSAVADREQITTLASRHGFDLIRTEPGLLHYLSPPFEAEALKMEGLDLPIWRSGDLCMYVRTARDVVASQDFQTGDNRAWRTFNVGPMIVKVKWDGTHETEKFSFQKVAGASSMRLRSVSRRSPLRSGINLWTSRNLALNVTRPDLACQSLQLLLEGHRCQEVVKALVTAGELSKTEADHLNELLTILINDAKQ
jgi:hypothetical protein